MSFPATRLRRMRRTETLRRMVRETHVRPADLIHPLFVVAGEDVREPIDALPGVAHLSVDRAVEAAHAAQEAGIAGVLLFGLPTYKDAEGSSAWDDDAAGAARDPRDHGRLPRPARGHRRLPLRVHRSRPLRRRRATARSTTTRRSSS